MAPGGEGGNTYVSKTDDEMEEIKNKIRVSKIGENNPNAVEIKCLNIFTREELHFKSAKDAQLYFQESNHGFAIRRCRLQVRSLYKGKWLFAYENDDYASCFVERLNPQKRRINVENIDTGESVDFNRISEAEEYFNIQSNDFRKITLLFGESFIALDKYKITAIN